MRVLVGVSQLWLVVGAFWFAELDDLGGSNGLVEDRFSIDVPIVFYSLISSGVMLATHTAEHRYSGHQPAPEPREHRYGEHASDWILELDGARTGT